MKAEGYMMSRKMLKVCVLIVGVALIMGFTAKTVSGKEQKSDVPSVEIYESMEADYLKEVKAVLAENHYSNSGVNMTKVFDTEEHRTYTIEIYHDRLSSADTEEQQALLNELMRLNDLRQYCTVEYVIAM